jgi:hypothetical protein
MLQFAYMYEDMLALMPVNAQTVTTAASVLLSLCACITTLCACACDAYVLCMHCRRNWRLWSINEAGLVSTSAQLDATADSITTLVSEHLNIASIHTMYA